MAVPVDGQGYPFGGQSIPQHQEVALGVFLVPEVGSGDGAGGVVYRTYQGEPGAATLQPGMGTAIPLEQHPFLGHPLPPRPVLRGTALPGTTQPRDQEEAPHRGPRQWDGFALRQQLREVLMIAAAIRRALR